MTPYEKPVDLSQHFDEIARNWMECEYLDASGEGKHVLRLLQPKANETGLDLAAGTGQLTAELASCGSRILAADVSEKMLKLAAARFVERLINNIVITSQDAHHMEFTPGLFDWAVCRYGFRYFNDPLLVLKELARVIRPGGRLYVSDWSDPASLLDDCFLLLDPAHRRVLPETWWHENLAACGFRIDQQRERPDRVDPVIWGRLSGLEDEEALSRFKRFREGPGSEAHYLELDGRPVLIARRIELLLVRQNPS